MFTRENLLQDLELFPQLAALKGVEQPVKWHPEGDALEHTLQVIEVQLKLFPDDLFLNIAALCHDFGKALTPADQWPKHYGHENAGIKPTREFLTKQLCWSKEHDLVEHICFTTKYHMHIHKADVLTGKTYRKVWLESKKVSANPLMLIQKLAQLGICDHFGRGNIDSIVDDRYMKPFLFYKVFCKASEMLPVAKNEKEEISIWNSVKESVWRFEHES